MATMTDPTDHQPEQHLDLHRPPPAADPPRDCREMQRGGRRTTGMVWTENSILQNPEPTLPDDVRVLKTSTHTPNWRLSSTSSRKKKRGGGSQNLDSAKDPKRSYCPGPSGVTRGWRGIFADYFDHFAQLLPQRFRVYRQPNTQRKLNGLGFGR